MFDAITASGGGRRRLHPPHQPGRLRRERGRYAGLRLCPAPQRGRLLHRPRSRTDRRTRREALQTNWIKLEVIGDRETLHPDVIELLAPPKNWLPTASPSCPSATTTPFLRNWPTPDRAVMPLGSPMAPAWASPTPRDRVDLCPQPRFRHPGRRHRHRVRRHALLGTWMQRRPAGTRRRQTRTRAAWPPPCAPRLKPA